MPSTASTLTVNTAADLAAVFPHLLGYHPSEQLVVGLLSDRALLEVAAFPLAGLPTPLDGLAAADAAAVQLAAALIPARGSVKIDELVPVWFVGSAAGRRRASQTPAVARPLLPALVLRLEELDCRLHHAGIVLDGRWVASSCISQDGCCRSTAQAAEAAQDAFRFRRPVPSLNREDLLAGLSEPTLDAPAVAAALARPRRSADARTVSELLSRRARSVEDLATILAALQDEETLALAAAAALDPASNITPSAASELVRAADPRHRPAAAFLAAAAFWGVGDGSRAATALRLAAGTPLARRLLADIAAGEPGAITASNLRAFAHQRRQPRSPQSLPAPACR